MTTSARLLPAAAAGTILFGDVEVPRMGFGAMRLPGGGHDRLASDRVLRRAVELGVRVIDTAEFYGDANSAIADALAPYRDDLVIATKAGPRRGRAGIVAETGPAGIAASVQDNLRHLRLDVLDVVHARKMPGLPFGELVHTLVELREQGLIRHIGVSNVTLADLRLALSMTPVASVQNAYSILDPRDDEVLTEAERLGIPYLPYFPLGGGAAGRVRATGAASPAQYALAWLLHRSPVMLPIPGTGSVAHLEENVAAAALEIAER